LSVIRYDLLETTADKGELAEHKICEMTAALCIDRAGIAAECLEAIDIRLQSRIVVTD
jgi:hypothetical protein